ncbi:hypothetical protein ABTX80_25040 [Streptomyces erythrochromogenes]|uniref:hypothetical protein n=1 Tax=Streptomyces erythrochromogenes TaxID=285574 RepID=UPI0033310BEB
MTVEATETPPVKRRRKPAQQDNHAAALKKKADAEQELVRWTPEEVVALKLLPYRSARVLRRKCNRREVWCHLDGGRITFTAEDIRRENERTAVAPLAA